MRRHILLYCIEPHIHKLRINRHNKVVQNIRKFLISNTKSRCFTLMNAGKFDAKSQENTISNWLLPCNCNTQSNRCQCNVRFQPNILCIQNLPYNKEPPTGPQHNLTIQFIAFTYCNDRYSLEKFQEKIVKYDILINDIKARGWNVDPILILIAGARGSTHKKFIIELKRIYNIPKQQTKILAKQINKNAIKYSMNMLLCKRKLENNQTILALPDFLKN
jgi:hypothetical protein